jgi:hypothetical protein
MSNAPKDLVVNGQLVKKDPQKICKLQIPTLQQNRISRLLLQCQLAMKQRRNHKNPETEDRAIVLVAIDEKEPIVNPKSNRIFLQRALMQRTHPH